MATQEEFINAILKEQNKTKDIRRSERSIRSQEQVLGSQPLIHRDEDFESNLRAVLPKHLIPSNVGSYKEIFWPFWYNFEFNYNDGAGNTFLPANGTLEVTKQVTNEASFIAVSFYRDYQETSQAGRGLPVQITIRDRQSSRQLNDEPVLIQHIGEKGEGTKFPTPYIFMPNARATLEISSILGSDLSIANADSTQRISFFGYRVRNEDMSKIMNKMYL